VRYLTLIITTCLLTGCARDVVMLNPRTGEAMTCRQSPLNPWSQQEACVSDHIAQGWRRLDSKQCWAKAKDHLRPRMERVVSGVDPSATQDHRRFLSRGRRRTHTQMHAGGFWRGGNATVSWKIAT